MPQNILGLVQTGFDNEIVIFGFAFYFKLRTLLKWFATTIIKFFAKNIFKHLFTSAQFLTQIQCNLTIKT